jgi:hypothetical protein
MNNQKNKKHLENNNSADIYPNFDYTEEVSDENENDEYVKKKKGCNDDSTEDEERNPKDYWTDETEDAVKEFLFLNEFFYETRIKEEKDDAAKNNRSVNWDYCKEMERRMKKVLEISDRKQQRDKIFREKLEKPLKKIAENILFRYKLFTPDIDSRSQQRDCFTFLYSKFVNFNPWINKKSYSFFGTIAKHFYLGNKKDYTKLLSVNYDYESNKDEADNKKIEDPIPYAKKDVSYDLFHYIIKSIEEEMEKKSLSKNDQRVGGAIIDIFKNHEIIGVYNKNQVYQLIKENTGLETKDVTYSLGRFRVLYGFLKQDFVKKQDE